VIAGIVGAEERKFTAYGKACALTFIRRIVLDPQVTEVCSGECPLGGVDKWARQVAEELGKKFTPFPPEGSSWEFFKRRNLQIARYSDALHNITVPYLPAGYTGRRFVYCYHCANDVLEPPAHVKSGGCWTLKKAREFGKKGILYVVKQEAR
jgi:hypothetical protein